MTHTERFSTAGLLPSERLAFWNRVGSEVYRDQVVVTPRQGESFGGELLYRSYGGVLITQVTTAPATVRGEPYRPVVRDSEYAALTIQDAGTLDSVQDGHSLRLQPGMVTASLRRQAYQMSFDETTRCIILKVPTARLTARVGDPTGMVVAPSRAALLANFLRTILAQQEPVCEPGAEAAISDVIFDLIAIAFRGRPAAAGTGQHATLGERWPSAVREFVDRHLDDPELGAALIAERLGVTPRYVQMVFAKMATTPSAYIVARRLERAAQLLASTREQIACVAHQVGFADLSYFYRCFRKRYGVSPGRYAAERCGSALPEG